jgi:DNA invertase Pin-like site-specific DNA recombinase
MLIVSYIRCSTGKQQKSGLGLEAQQKAVAGYANTNNAEIVKEYVEVESGRKVNRPQLAAAIAHARRAGARLVVAKLDRLARNAGFMCSLVDSGLDFCAVDNPTITPMVAKILAVVAEEEARLISVRTKDALAAAKARGIILGAPAHRRRRLERESILAGARASGRASRRRAMDAYADISPRIRQMRSEGHSLAEIASILTQEGITTRNGAEITKMHVKRILDRLAA